MSEVLGDVDVAVPGSAPPGPPARHHTSRALLRTARPKQWSKNLLVFAAPGAAGVLTHGGALGRTLLAFLAFSAVSSGTYFLNDVIDAEADRQHPSKQRRPVASGELGTRQALSAGSLLLAAGLAGATAIAWQLGVVVGVYLAVQLCYSLYLKHQAIFDLAAVASGFVLRAIAGGVAARVPVSEWFLIVATFGSMMMVTGKRLAEHAELGTDRGLHRPILDAYTPAFLRTMLAISASGAIIGYALWAFGIGDSLRQHGDPIFYQLSLVPVMIAMLRYAFLVDQGKGGKPEELVFGDRPLQVLGLAWAALFALAVYAS